MESIQGNNASIFDSGLGLERKKRLLKILIGFGTVVLVTLGTVAFFQGNTVLAVSDWVVGAAFVGCIAYLSKTGRMQGVAWFGLTCLGVLFLYLLIKGGVHFTGFVWILTYPALAIYLLGALRGGAISGSVVVAFLVVRAFFPQLLGSGHPYSPEFLIRFIPSIGVVGFVSVHMDLAWREARQVIAKKNEQLHHLSRHDALTGVYNRRLFDEELASCWSRATRAGGPLSLLMVDIDHFKKYNDRYGHQLGDEALAAAASVLCAQASRRSDVVARYGGEEFAVILPVTEFAGALHIADSILGGISDLDVAHQDGNDGKLSVSIGVACYDASHTYPSAVALLKGADAALYQAKALGRNTYCPKAVSADGHAGDRAGEIPADAAVAGSAEPQLAAGAEPQPEGGGPDRC